MAGASLFALLDDIATVLDDVAILTKVAAKKTAGVLGDDLALNAQQVAGVAADRELPVVWAVAKGSMINKAILVPAALGISAAAPWAVTPLLMLGGAYLCFEGVEKLFHKFFHAKEEAAHREEILQVVSNPKMDMLAFEKDKVKGAIRTDFVLSAEIIVIALGTVAGKPFASQLAVLAGIAALMTVGVYGFVAMIVKLDDVGLWLTNRPRATAPARLLGNGLLRGAPWLMKALSVLGTAAMFLVGGGILVHGIPPVAHWMETLPGALHPLVNAATGVVGGIVALALVMAGTWAWNARRKQAK
jgi:predicted DNA repair protein MutK